MAAWANDTAYAIGDRVTKSGEEYYCYHAHTSDSSAEDENEPEVANWVNYWREVRYVDVGASGANNGKTKTDAWQSLAAVIGNTQSGTYTAGAIIFVRTHNGTANLEESFSSGIGFTSMVATRAARTTLRFDDGTEWANGGVFRLYTASAVLTIGGWTIIDADGLNHRFLLDSTKTSGYHYLWVFVQGESSGVHVRNTAGAEMVVNGGYTTVALGCHEDTLIEYSKLYSNSYAPLTLDDRPGLSFRRLVIDVSAVTGQSAGAPFFLSSGNAPAGFFVDGLEIIDAWAGAVLGVFAPNGSYPFTARHKFIGLKCNTAMSLNGATRGTGDWAISGRWPLLQIEEANGEFNFYNDYFHNIVEYARGEYYPYLNSFLPTPLNDGWSYKITPQDGSSEQTPEFLSTIKKIHTGSAANRTLTFEMLLSDQYAHLNKDILYVNVSYIDSSGDRQLITSKAEGLLATSTANWSYTNYGSKTYVKRKIAITTTSAIAAGALITADIFSGIERVGADDFWFLEPDFDIST